MSSKPVKRLSTASTRVPPVPKKKSAARPKHQYILSLFVAGATARSQQIIMNVRQLCEAKLKNDYTLEVIDIYQQPALLREHQIIATPTLIKDSPKPPSRFIGSLAIITGLSAELNSYLLNVSSG